MRNPLHADRRSSTRWPFVLVACLWSGAAALDYYGAHGDASAFYAVLGASALLAAVVAVPAHLRRRSETESG